MFFATTSYEAILEKDEEEKIFEKSDIQNRQYGSLLIRTSFYIALKMEAGLFALCMCANTK